MLVLVLAGALVLLRVLVLACALELLMSLRALVLVCALVVGGHVCALAQQSCVGWSAGHALSGGGPALGQ